MRLRLHPFIALVTLLVALAACTLTRDAPADSGSTAAGGDSAAAVRLAFDSLTQRWRQAQLVDSVSWRHDTADVWIGPREWLATDRPTTVVTVLLPRRIIAVRHIFGG